MIQMGEREEVPAWSGQFYYAGDPGGDSPWGKGPIVCLLHVADTRSPQPPPGWEHIGTCETESGDIEIHIYDRSPDG